MDDGKNNTESSRFGLGATPDHHTDTDIENNSTEYLGRDTTSAPKYADSSDADVDGGSLHVAKLFSLVFGLALAVFLVAVDSSILATAIPRITSDFKTLADIGWYGSAYFLATCAVQPLCGKIYTHYSTKLTFLVFLGIFELGSLLCAVSTGSKMLIVGRVIAGIGSSGLFSGSFNICSLAFRPQKRPIIIGIITSFFAVGAVAGPLIGGVLTESVTWRWCFFINLPCGAVTAVVILLIQLPDKTQGSTKMTTLTKLKSLDLLGFVIFAASCTMLLMALQWGGNGYAWNSSTIIGLFCGSGVTIALFFWWQNRKGDEAMIPLTIFKQQTVFFAFLTMLFQGGQMLSSYYLPIWFQVVKDANPKRSGIMTVPTMISQMFSASISGLLGTFSKLGYYTPFAIVGCILATVGSALFTTFTPSTSTIQWAGYQVLFGFGRGMVSQVPIVAVQTVLPESQNAIGSSVIVFAQFFGGALFVAVGQTAFANTLQPALQTYIPSVDPLEMLNAGAAEVRLIAAKYGPAVVEGAVLAYNKSLTETLYLGVGAAGVAFLTSWGMEWKSVKKTKVQQIAP